MIRRNGRDARRGDDRGGRQPQMPRQAGRQVSASACFYTSETIIANPPFGRTNGCPFSTTEA